MPTAPDAATSVVSNQFSVARIVDAWWMTTAATPTGRLVLIAEFLGGFKAAGRVPWSSRLSGSSH